jgi:hypothetical protein
VRDELSDQIERGIANDVRRERAIAEQEIETSVKVRIAAIDEIGGDDVVAVAVGGFGNSADSARRIPNLSGELLDLGQAS